MCYIKLSLQIYNCLQPFMVCMSARVTSRIVDKIVEDYNVEVLFWADELRDNLKVFNFGLMSNFYCMLSNNIV